MLSRFSLVGVFGFALLFTGCGGGTTTGTGGGGGNTNNPTASLSGSSLSFSSSTPNQATSAQTITLTNNGTATLSIASITLSGTNASNFAQTTNCAAYLAQNASCTISATFTPATAASYSATITVTDNSGGTSGATQTISLTGALTAPQATLSASTLTFTGVNAGTTASPQSVTLTNGGTATLNISSIALGGTNAAQFAETTTCGATLAAGANCSISATFTPATASTYGATITVSDNASGSPQVITLSGTGVSPGISLSQTSITFPASALGVTTAATTVTLTNNGTATLNISSIALSGTNTAQFGETTTCGATLSAGSNCSIAVTFTPAAASTYTAKVLITDNATGSPQSISLTGSGAGAVSYTLYSFPLNNSVQPLYDLVNAAQHSIDVTMYALQDTTFVNDLVNACKRGVTVRVILDQNNEKSNDTPAYNALNAQAGCSAVWANKAFQVTHQKSIVVDNTQVAIMSLNLQSQYYSTTRDFAMIENDAADIAAIEATFNADYAAGTPPSGVAGPSDFSSYLPGPGDTSVLPGGDLIWSPTTAQAAMTNIIANAQSSLLIENEEMASSASYIVNALVTACQTKKLDVKIAMVNQSSYTTSFNTLKAAGCSLHLWPDTNTGYYIHAKAVIADYGQPTQSVYMGSINYSNASMTQNRELGMYITDQVSVGQLYTGMMSDYNGGTAY